MKINDVQVSSFGRFKDFKQEFGDHFNLVYGPNEAGKSTLLTFLEFMLFGPKKEGHTRKYYLDAHERYQPWEGTSYEGFLRFTLPGDKRLYEVYRNFLKDKDVVTLHDARLGKDLSDAFTRDKRDELLFAREMLGISRSIFLNTIMIPQLALKEGFLADSKELSAQIIKSLSGSTNDRGTDDALTLLERGLTEGVGKTDRGKRAGELLRRIDELEADKRKAVEHRHRLAEYKASLRNLQKREKTLQDLQAQLEQKKALERKKELENQIERADRLKTEIAETRKRAQEYLEYQHFPLDMVEETADLERRKNDFIGHKEEVEAKKQTVMEELNAHNLELMPLDDYIDVEPRVKKEIVDLKYRWINARGELEKVRNQVTAERQKTREKRNRFDELHDLFSALGDDVEDRVEYLENELERLDQEMVSATRQAKELAQNTGQTRSMTIACTFFSFIAAMAAVLFAIWNHGNPTAVPFVSPILALLASGGAACAIYFRRDDRSLKKKFDELQDNYESYIEDRKHAVRERSTVFSLAGVKNLKEFYTLENEYEALKAEMENSAVHIYEKRLPKLEEAEKDLRRDILTILHSVGLNRDSSVPREKDIDLFVANVERTEKAAEKVDRSHAKLEEIEKSRQELERKEDEVKRQLKSIYQRTSTRNYADFQRHKEGRIAYDKCLQTISNNERNLEYLLKETSISDLKNELAGLERVLEDVESDTVFDGPFKVGELDKTRAQLIRTREEIASLEGQISQLLDTYTDPASFDLETENCREELARIHRRRAALQLAISTITQSREELHADFAPHINERISGLISDITGGRYDKVMTSDNFEISVRTPGSGSIVSADSLSCGTRDQIFFAARLAIAGVLSGNESPLPLFFDDCFVEYDYDRASQAFEVLGRLARDRQILFFTCHEREKALAEAAIPADKCELIDLSRMNDA